ncbi:MAG: hypothetical protein GY801_10655 [bacterium]|nr:hypothetical protein [bacterium]
MKKSQENAGEQAARRMLKAVYSQRETGPIEPGIRWRQDVMRDLRRIGPLTVQAVNPLRIFERFVWRFATAACALVLFLSVYAGVNGWNPLDDLDAQFFNNPVEFTVAQAFGMYDSYE